MPPTAGPTPDDGFVCIDLDNLTRYSLWPTLDAFDGAAAGKLLEDIYAQTGVRPAGGYGSMNRATADALRYAVHNVFNDWRVEVRVVANEPQAADKDLFYAVGRAVAQGYRRFVFVSKDKGFTDAAHRLRGDVRDAEVFVVVDNLETDILAQWSRVENVTFLELRPRAAAPRPPVMPPRPPVMSPPPRPPVAAPPAAVRSPMWPGAAPPGFSVPGSGSAAAAPRVAPPPAPPLPAAPPPRPVVAAPRPLLTQAPPPAPPDDIILVCRMCGRRTAQAAAAANALCPSCGAELTTDHGDRVVPPGAVPYRDGAPAVEVYFQGRLRRTVVVVGHSATFGREADPTKPNHFGLGDLVSTPNRISRDQFEVKKAGDEWRLTRHGDRLMFAADGTTGLPLGTAQPLAHGDEFWVNEDKSSDHGARLRFVFRTQARATAGRTP